MMKYILFTATIMVLLAFTPSDGLVGRWESKSKTGNITGVLFRPDNTFEVYVNKKAFVSGKYSLQGSIFTMEDNSCEGAKGIYKVTFFADSLRLEVIMDDCDGRKQGTHNRVFGRVKVEG